MSQLKENQVLMLQVRQGKVKSHQKLRTDLVQRKDQIQEDQIEFLKEAQLTVHQKQAFLIRCSTNLKFSRHL